MLAFITIRSFSKHPRERWTWSLVLGPLELNHTEMLYKSPGFWAWFSTWFIWSYSGVLWQFRLRQDIWSENFGQKSLRTKLMNGPSISTGGVRRKQKRNPRICIHVYTFTQLVFGAKFSIWSNFFQAHSK